MKDIHNHILFGIDDGCDNLEESIKLIEKAKDNGYTALVLTPHYRQSQNFVCDNKKKMRIFEELKEEVESRGIGISLYLGNEIAIDEDLFYFLKTDQLLSLNNSRYILIELPLYQEFSKTEEYLDKLLGMGLVPVIAHPERYGYYKNLDKFTDMVKKGILFQGNIGSLYGKYGRVAKERLEDMLKRHMIHFIASDVHHVNQTSYNRITDTFKRIEELTGSSKMAEELVSLNIDKVINDEKIDPYLIRVKKMKFKVVRSK